MDTPMPDFAFRLMTLTLSLRDMFRPRLPILEDVNLKPGQRVLDFGCGPGSYSLLAAQTVGPRGKVYALDMQPLALERVSRMAQERGLTNLEVIQTNMNTGLAEESIDVILLFDVFHMFSQPKAILNELARVIKPNGVLAVNDHHLIKAEILTGITAGGHFTLVSETPHNYIFAPQAAV